MKISCVVAQGRYVSSNTGRDSPARIRSMAGLLKYQLRNTSIIAGMPCAVGLEHAI